MIFTVAFLKKLGCMWMRIRKLALLIILFYLAGHASAEFPSRVRPSGQSITSEEFLKRLEVAKDKAISATGSIKNSVTPRVVAKGAQPQIIIKGDIIYFNDSGVRMGDSLAAWRKALTTVPRCSTEGITVCVWDDWGLQIATGDKNKTAITSMNLFFNFVDDEGINLGSVDTTFGNKERLDRNWAVERAFLGYFELDGFGIDSDTKFWEIRTGTGYKRALECGLRDCMFPKGTFGKQGRLYLTLNGSSDRATVRKFSISSEGFAD